jgi:predicted HTH transcriptional regulator
LQTKNIYPRNWSCRTLCWRDWQTSGSVKVVRINKVGNKVGDKKPLNSRRQKIISEMRDNPNITTAELHNILGVSETAVEKNISFLRDNGYIERVGSKKAGYWKVL